MRTTRPSKIGSALGLMALHFAVLFALPLEPAFADGMKKYSTPEVHLFTDLGKEKAKILLDEIAFFTQYIDRYFRSFGITPRKESPVRCRVLARTKDFYEYSRKRNVGRFAGAYYSPGDNVIIAPYEGGKSTLLHECTHLVSHRYFNDDSIWFDEGLACLFEAAAFDDHHNMITFCSDASRLKSMRFLIDRDGMLEWDRLFEYQSRRLWRDEIERGELDISTFYTQSWGVIFYYARAEDEKRKALFKKFIQGMHTGRERTKLIQEDLTRRQDEFKAFFRMEHEYVLKRYRNAEKLRRMKKFDAALDSLLKILEIDPQNRAAIRLCAEVAWDGDRYGPSLEYWNYLAEQDPENTEYTWRICRCMVAKGLEDNDNALLEEALKAGKAAVKKTRSKDPDCLAARAMAHFALGQVREALSSIKNANRFKCDDSEFYRSLEKTYSDALRNR